MTTIELEHSTADDKKTDKKRASILTIAGTVIVVVVIFCAIFGYAVVPFDPTLPTSNVSVPPPPLAQWPGLFVTALFDASAEPVHWFGTDSSGLDVFSRVVTSARADLIIALSATVLSAVIGVTIGIFTGYFQNWVSEVVMRASDVLQSFPVFISAMILVALAGRSYGNIILSLSLVYAPIFIRLTRAEVMSQSSRGFVQAAQALGNNKLQIAIKHILPNCLGPAIIQLSVTIGFAILLTAGLSFVGAGIRPPEPEWGLMISGGAGNLIIGEWWTSVFPGIAISLTVFGFAVVGNELETRYEE